MGKREFSHSERYAVWVNHGKTCWLCREPLRLKEVTIDHVLPESLLGDDEKRIKILAEYGLPSSFNINGFENWLPCHNHCNQGKGNTALKFAPADRLVLDRLIRLAPKVRHTAEAIEANVEKDKVFAKVFAAVELGTVTLADLQVLMKDLRSRAGPQLPRDLRKAWITLYEAVFFEIMIAMIMDAKYAGSRPAKEKLNKTQLRKVSKYAAEYFIDNAAGDVSQEQVHQLKARAMEHALGRLNDEDDEENK